MQTENVILVNEQDQAVGTMEKLEAHRQGLLHRAISVFIFDNDKRLLLQQRALSKYHSAGLWTNTCCSHPVPSEEALAAAHRRLGEEMGLETPLTFAFTFLYRTPFDNGLVEHELDHVFIGHTNKTPLINPEEVADYQWWRFEDLQDEIQSNPQAYTVWFRLIYQKVFALV
ncbi:isopentenyl-diphosphate Delta-isomerase [Parapedobacter tibetensis]|uniref:isopentenyl-diphosphate Delta-isomerase n=1 Tax=Parapedobacter tibetensis TaxID=2972951 RepID=UPI00214D2F63|nr:isopentenyl-diphosphate Delta-isomerase [Parapedobacter tibetensis]